MVVETGRSVRWPKWVTVCACGWTGPLCMSEATAASDWRSKHREPEERREALDARYGAEVPF